MNGDRDFDAVCLEQLLIPHDLFVASNAMVLGAVLFTRTEFVYLEYNLKTKNAPGVPAALSRASHGLHTCISKPSTCRSGVLGAGLCIVNLKFLGNHSSHSVHLHPVVPRQ
jgi:hypothetical protein